MTQMYTKSDLKFPQTSSNRILPQVAMTNNEQLVMVGQSQPRQTVRRVTDLGSQTDCVEFDMTDERGNITAMSLFTNLSAEMSTQIDTSLVLPRHLLDP